MEIAAESAWVPYEGEQLHLMRLYDPGRPLGDAVLMIHGSLESGTIFYSKKMKGLGPFLARQGFDVYVPDLRGRGQSKPSVHRGMAHSQRDTIMRELPALVAAIRERRGPDVPLHAAAHSWGGVLLLAYLARFPQETFRSMAFFGTKRSISVGGREKWVAVNLMWNVVGEIGTALAGYLPGRRLGMGAEDEPAGVYRDCRAWVGSCHAWLDPTDGFDYRRALKARDLPPTLYWAGLNDAYLGHPTDVARLMEEAGHARGELRVLSVANGYARDYGHIDMCTAREAEQEHFPETAQWMRRHGG